MKRFLFKAGLLVGVSVFILSLCTVILKRWKPDLFPGVIWNQWKTRLFALTEGTDEGDIESLYLTLTPETVRHLEAIYHQFENGDVAGYQKNNVWHNARLHYQGEMYRVKIKSHGKTPAGHRVGRYISLGVKILDEGSLFGTSRFRLIIYDRIREFADLVGYFAETFGLYKDQHHLVRLHINDWRPKLYYVERKLSDPLMEALGDAALRILPGGMMVTTRLVPRRRPLSSEELMILQEEEKVALLKRIEEGLKQTTFSTEGKEAVKQRLVRLNEKIIHKNSEAIMDFFDFDYLTSYGAARLLAGFWGHGFLSDNFQIIYNQTDGKIYPAIHRDNHLGSLFSQTQFEHDLAIIDLPPHTDSRLHHILLLQTLSQDDDYRQEKYRKVWSLLSNPEAMQRTDRWMADLKERHQRWGGFLYTKFVQTRDFVKKISGIYRPPLDVRSNWDRFRTVLDKASMELLVATKGNKIFLTFLTDSVSSLRVKELLLPLDSGVVLQLSPYFEQQFFSNDLDKDLVSHPRFYHFVVEHEKPVAVVLEKIRIKVVNGITGRELTHEEVQINAHKDFVEKEATPLPLAEQKEKKISTVVLRAGRHVLHQNFILPKGQKLILEAGAKLKLAPGVSILTYGGLEVRGTQGQPVIVESLDPRLPFGAVGVVGKNDSSSDIHWLRLSGGSESWVDGIYLSGGLSLYRQKKVTIHHSEIYDNHADDGLNIKYSEVDLQKNNFHSNFVDQVDLDYCMGRVLNNLFTSYYGKDTGGDGIDFSGSKVLLSQNKFVGHQDKGISIGESSVLVVIHNMLKNNRVAIAVKDSSKAFLYDNGFQGNQKNGMAYQKKNIFGGGAFYFVNQKPSDTKLYFLDTRSNGYYNTRQIKEEEIIQKVFQQGDLGEVWLNLNPMMSYLFERPL